MTYEAHLIGTVLSALLYIMVSLPVSNSLTGNPVCLCINPAHVHYSRLMLNLISEGDTVFLQGCYLQVGK